MVFTQLDGWNRGGVVEHEACRLPMFFTMALNFFGVFEFKPTMGGHQNSKH